MGAGKGYLVSTEIEIAEVVGVTLAPVVVLLSWSNVLSERRAARIALACGLGRSAGRGPLALVFEEADDVRHSLQKATLNRAVACDSGRSEKIRENQSVGVVDKEDRRVYTDVTNKFRSM